MEIGASHWKGEIIMNEIAGGGGGTAWFIDN